MTWYNPKTWFKRKPKPPLTWVLVTPFDPYIGLSEFSDAKDAPFAPAIGVSGLTLEQAKAFLTGKVLHFAKMDPEVRFMLEEEYTLIMLLKDFKKLLKGDPQ